MSSRPGVKSAFQNLRPTIMREPTRSNVSVEAEERLLATSPKAPAPVQPETLTVSVQAVPSPFQPPLAGEPPPRTLLLKKKKERLLLVSFRMPQGLKERLELVAKTHEINQTDIINEAIEMNLQRYM